MADATLTATPVGNPTVFGDKHVRVVDVTFTGNYRTGGVALTPADVGLPNAIEFVLVGGGVAPASALSTGNGVYYDHANDAFVMFENGASGAALAEKTDNEAVPTGQVLRCVVFGH